jgi:hypothetical protein
LEAGVDSGVLVPERCAGDVNGVETKVHGPAGTDEIVCSDACLRGEVPDAGVGVGTIVNLVEGRPAKGRILVIGPDDAAAALDPGRDAVRAGEVPAKDDRGDRGSREGSANGVGGRADIGSGTHGALELWRVGLPERKDLDGVLEVAVQGAWTEVWGEDLAGVDACHEELEAAAVGEAKATLGEDADLPGEVGGVRLKGRERGDSRSGLRHDEGRGQDEGQSPDSHLSYAANLGHWLSWFDDTE